MSDEFQKIKFALQRLSWAVFLEGFSRSLLAKKKCAMCQIAQMQLMKFFQP